MTRQANPVEKALAQLCRQWNAAVASSSAPVIVWNVDSSGERLLSTFFEAQRHAGDEALDYHTPDLFITLDAVFDTTFGYSRSLCESLIGNYRASKKSFADQGIPHDWAYDRVEHPDSASGFVALLNSFALHLQAQFRCAAIVLMPSKVSAEHAFNDWVRAVLQAKVAANIRLVLLQNSAWPRWAQLRKDHAAQVQMIDSPIDMMSVARETAAQSPSAGPAVAYRQLLTDVFTLVEKGTARQTSERADTALHIASREQWYDQQVVLHMAVAGAHQKEKNAAAAIEAYRRARASAEAAHATDAALSANLVMQTWFGEAGVWLMEGALPVAAQAYVSAAEAAQKISHRFFALEGYRMAAYCHAEDGQADKARHHGALAAREGKAMPAEERTASTLGLALNDLLKLQDAKRSAELKRLADVYQAEIAAAHQQAEAEAKALGAAPERAAIDRIDRIMEARFERAFEKLRNERERVIASGDAYFRKVVAVGRDLIHPQWSGFPEVSHPLDKEQAAWEKMPTSAELPPAGDLMPSSQDLAVTT